LDISVSYHIATHDPHIFDKIKEEINYKILDIIQKNEIKIAHPIFKPFGV
jgi:small-conductance mechanosensitive channel